MEAPLDWLLRIVLLLNFQYKLAKAKLLLSRTFAAKTKSGNSWHPIRKIDIMKEHTILKGSAMPCSVVEQAKRRKKITDQFELKYKFCFLLNMWN